MTEQDNSISGRIIRAQAEGRVYGKFEMFPREHRDVRAMTLDRRSEEGQELTPEEHHELALSRGEVEPTAGEALFMNLEDVIWNPVLHREFGVFMEGYVIPTNVANGLLSPEQGADLTQFSKDMRVFNAREAGQQG